jgi:hypothetical protein
MINVPRTFSGRHVAPNTCGSKMRSFAPPVNEHSTSVRRRALLQPHNSISDDTVVLSEEPQKLAVFEKYGRVVCKWL